MLDCVDNDASPLANTEVHAFDSQTVGDRFKIFIGHCDVEVDEPRAALYVTDANGFFGAAVDIVRSMQLSRHLPPIIVVGIGYFMGGLGETVAIRVRDLSPSDDPLFASMYDEPPVMAGADRFRSFITTELMPWVERRFGVPRDRACYFGHSLGGLFGTHMLFAEPEAFSGYVISSPSLWWNHREMFGTEAKYAATHDDLAVKAYFGIGAAEDHDGRQREASRLPDKERNMANLIHLDMVDQMCTMVDRLRSHEYLGLRLESMVFPDEMHVTVPTLVLSHGLRFLYDAPH